MPLSFPVNLALSGAVVLGLTLVSTSIERLRVHRKAEYRRRIRNETRHKQELADSRGKKLAKNSDTQRIIAALNSIAEQQKSNCDEERSQQPRETFWKALEVSGLWAAAAVGVWAITVGSQDAESQRDVMSDQFRLAQETFIQTSRAWVTVEPEVKTANMTWINDDMHFAVTLDISNLGNSPAMDAWGFIDFVLPENTIIPLIDKAKKACNGAAKVGVLLFPDKSVLPVPTGKALESQAVVDWFTDVRRTYRRDNFPSFPMDLVVCVNYKIIGDSLIHHTGKIYIIDDKNFMEARYKVDIPAGDMSLRVDPHGHFAD